MAKMQMSTAASNPTPMASFCTAENGLHITTI